MSCSLHIVKTGDFVRLNAEGEYDIAASDRALRSIVKSCVDRGIDNALLDVRSSRGNITVGQLHELTNIFHELGFGDRHRLAVLHRYRGGEKAELFAIFAESRGWNVRAFDSFEDAIEWFSEEEPVRLREKP